MNFLYLFICPFGISFLYIYFFLGFICIVLFFMSRCFGAPYSVRKAHKVVEFEAYGFCVIVQNLGFCLAFKLISL